MAVEVEMQNTGDPALRAEIIAVIEHMFADRKGIWQVSIIGSQDRAAWYLKVTGPNAFERSYTLERAAGEQRVEVIRAILSKLLPRKN
jgi:hypothetical protein